MVLQYIGCGNKHILQAACKQHGGEIDIKKDLLMKGIEENSSGSIAVLFGDTVFHRTTSAKDDGITDQSETAKF